MPEYQTKTAHQRAWAVFVFQLKKTIVLLTKLSAYDLLRL